MKEAVVKTLANIINVDSAWIHAEIYACVFSVMPSVV